MNTFEDIQRDAEALSLKAEARLQEIEAQKAELTAEAAQLRLYVRKPSNNGRSARKPSTHSLGPSAGAMQRTAAAIQTSLQEEPFSLNDLTAASHLHNTTAGKVIKELRAQEVIRAAEKVRRNRSGHPTQLYRVMDADRLNQLAEAN